MTLLTLAACRGEHIASESVVAISLRVVAISLWGSLTALIMLI